MKKRTVILLAVMLVLLLASCGVYAGIGVYYKTHFYEHTWLNGLEISGCTAEEAEAKLADQVEGYRLIIRPKEGGEEIITGEQIGYHLASGEEITRLLDRQLPLLWLPVWLEKEHHLNVSETAVYDEKMLEDRIASLDFLQEDRIIPAKDAYIDLQDGEYVVVPEQEGMEPDKEKVASLIGSAVDAGTTKLYLEEADCYRSPKVLSDDGSLRAEAAILNKYSSITITYNLGGGVTETLEKETTAKWFTLDEDKKPVFDREQIRSWVDGLADRYDTIGTYQPFVTSNQETVYPESRTYGWQMDREREAEELAALLEKGESAGRDPVWLESAAGRGENDIGSSYVEIDYTNQHLWYYKNGELYVETAVVTGNTSLGQGSPEGIFCIVGKEQNAILKGEGYETPVNWWMPFYEGVGIHDADTWRSTYGGTIYQYGGSHGCINTPSAAASLIFENIEIGTPVVCYRSEYNYGYPEVPVSSGTYQEPVPNQEDVYQDDLGGSDSDGYDSNGYDSNGYDPNVYDGGQDSLDGLVWDDVTIIPEPEQEPDLIIDGGDEWYIPEDDWTWNEEYGGDWDDNMDLPVG